MKTPKNWPSGFRYSPVSIHLGISANMFRNLLSSPLPESKHRIADCIERQNVHPHLEIRKISDISHPLAGQHGVFSTAQIANGTELGEYVGEIFFGQESYEEPRCFKGVHCWRAIFGPFTLNISSERIANELAFINDYRGLQKHPNVRAKWILHRGFYYFGFETARQIEPMEELLVDYGKTWEKTRGQS